MSALRVNINGIHELDFVLPGTTTGAITSPGVVTITNTQSSSSGSIGITIDGGGSVPSAGLKGFIQIPYACTITGWSIIADRSGSASLDVWFLAGSAPPVAPSIPTSTNIISASAPVALSSSQSASGGTAAISTWTTAVSQWGTIAFNLTAASTVTRITIELQVAKT